MKVSVIGSGSWGTANAVMLAKMGHSVILWSYSSQECEDLKKYRENKPFLPGIKIPETIEFTNNIGECADVDLIVMAVPSFAARATAKSIAPHVKDGQIIANIAKGLEEESLFTLSQVIGSEIPNADVAVMSGPSHAEEVSRSQPSTNVVAAKNIETAEFVQDIFMNPYFRVYTNADILGVELGGALKNIIALCAGISDGLGYGDNTKAALMTRGIAEMTRLGVAMGARAETFGGLSGVGDLIVTCCSAHSRNRRCGMLLGQGKTLAQAQEEIKMVVEGVNATRAAKALAQKFGVEMPIVNQCYSVLYEGQLPRNVAANLMGRTRRGESEYGFLGEAGK
ncbi:MAG: NAD(P)H-dependent glycerol-3-phosphate dehydrogenase [Oscillospiraceae bacterium]|nr:NAD(P)H-dependent glycerol-3-phosphate dehydrogenase [Oscillospiraceae bacterium]